MIDFTFSHLPLLSTGNFSMRNLLPTDDHEIFALRSSEEINRYLDRPKANSIDDARNFIARITAGIANNESIFWVITPKNASEFLGTICLWKISREESKAEIGFELLPEHHGKGIMQEVIPEVIRFGFEQMKLDAIEAELSPRNLKSVKLLERNHFILKSESYNDDPDSVIYKLSKTQKEL
jgi:Acetyltransferases, including N-acetylases of ribosomal proteins